MDIFMVSLALGLVLAIGRFKAFALIIVVGILLVIGIASMAWSPAFDSILGTQLGYLAGVFIRGNE